MEKKVIYGIRKLQSLSGTGDVVLLFKRQQSHYKEKVIFHLFLVSGGGGC